MIRRMTLCCALLLGACGDDSNPKTKDDAGTQTEKVDAGRDAGPSVDTGAPTEPEPPVTPDIVTNVGRSCSGDAACMGAKPLCQATLSLIGQEIIFPGGYCSAPCTDNRECGEGGECPVGESMKDIPIAFRGLFLGAAPSHCYERCAQDSDCRSDEKYRCASIYTALIEGAGAAGLSIGGFDITSFLTGPIKERKYCLPPAPEVPVAGPATVDAGPSAASDAGTSDAAAAAAGDL